MMPAAMSDLGAMACDSLFLGSLSADAVARLTPHAEIEHVASRQTLFRAGESPRSIYFPCTAVVSLVGHAESGESLEVGLVGREGLVGATALRGRGGAVCDAVVQIAGLTIRVPASVFMRDMLADRDVSDAVGRFTELLLARTMQLALCNRFHDVEQRCVRWLLTVADTLNSDALPLTHELLATMLGVHRPTVTVVLGGLRRRGLITDTRGVLALGDRSRLETACCECYRLMRDEQRRLLGY